PFSARGAHPARTTFLQYGGRPRYRAWDARWLEAVALLERALHEIRGETGRFIRQSGASRDLTIDPFAARTKDGRPRDKGVYRIGPGWHRDRHGPRDLRVHVEGTEQAAVFFKVDDFAPSHAVGDGPLCRIPNARIGAVRRTEHELVRAIRHAP